MEFYHVLNRGINKQDVFNNDDDRMRFVKGLFVFNDRGPAPNANSQITKRKDEKRKREVIVNIHAWCLMSNHYHLLVSPKDDDEANISLFMRKVNMGYAKFFNEKYGRKGYLWQGKYKKVQIERDNQFLYIPYYIHLNPLDMKFKDWRNGELQSFKEPLEFLDSYRWSSWQDYNGIKNFPSVLYPNLLKKVLGSKDEQIKAIRYITTNHLLKHNLQLLET